MSARRLIAVQIIAVDEWMVESCTSTSIWKKKNIYPGKLYLCLGFWKEHLFEHSPFWVITLLQPLWMKNCCTLTTSFLLTTLTPVLHSSGTSFINWFGLVALFGTQDKCVPNNWTYCQWTLPAAISAGSETTRWCLMNGGICGKYWSFHKTYRDGDRQWTLMDWMLWRSTWNQTVVLDSLLLWMPSADCQGEDNPHSILGDSGCGSCRKNPLLHQLPQFRRAFQYSEAHH